MVPVDGTELGIGYRSHVRQNLTGTFINGAAAGALPPAAAIGGAYGIESKVTLPETITLGLRQRVTNDLTLLAGYEWTRWSRFNKFPVCITSPAPFPTAAGCPASLALDFRYSDGWFASVGAEYNWNSNLTLRAGLAYEKSPINDVVRSSRLPDSDRIWATIGVGYKISNKLSLDASYAHIFAKSGSVNIVPGHPSYNGLTFLATSKGRVDILSVALNYRWDDPKITAPIIAKH